MTRSLGTIRQRPDGRYEARISLPYGGRRSRYARSEQGARDALAALISERDNATVRRSSVTVATFAERWILNAKLAPRSRARYRDALRLHVNPELGRIPVGKLEVHDVEHMIRRLEGRGLSPATVRYALAVLRIALGRAVREGLASRNVAALVDSPAVPRRPIDPPTDAELRAIVAAAAAEPAPFPLLLRLAIATGMRQGEALGLTWGDVDVDGATVTIASSLPYGTRDLGPTKTDGSRRTIRVGHDLAAELGAERRRQVAAHVVTPFVFATRTGRPLHARNVLRRFAESCDRAGVAHYRWHDLRHAAVTRLLAQGVDLALISRWVGHTKYSTTVDVYGHIRASAVAPELLDLVARSDP